MKIFICWIMALQVCIALATASPRSAIRSGNAAYSKEKYDEALEKYVQAESAERSRYIAVFNKGNVYYKTGAYEDALKSYEYSAYSADRNLQQQAYYNMGNAFYRMNKLPEAIQYYKKSLEMDPSDRDAKFNLEFAQKKLKENLDKESGSENESGEPDKSQQQKNGEPQPGSEEKPEDDREASNQEQESQEEQQKPAMSREDAQRLLESAETEKHPDKQADVKAPVFGMPEQDW